MLPFSKVVSCCGSREASFSTNGELALKPPTLTIALRKAPAAFIEGLLVFTFTFLKVLTIAFLPLAA